MKRLDCPHEREVVQTIVGSGWPGSADAALRQHVEQCPGCREVADVTAIFRMDRATCGGDVRLPAAGLVWWRAAVRARTESVQRAARPVTWMHGLAGACAAGIGCAVAAFMWPTLRSVTGRLATVVLELDPASRELAAPMLAAVGRSLPLAFGIAGCVLLAPLIVLYFALSDE